MVVEHHPEAHAVAAEPGAVSGVLEPEARAVAVETGAARVLEPAARAAAVEPGAVSGVLEPEARAVAAETGAVSGVLEPAAVSDDIAAAFVALVPASVVVVEGDSSGRPKFPACPSVYHFASSPSSVEAVG